MAKRLIFLQLMTTIQIIGTILSCIKLLLVTPFAFLFNLICNIADKSFSNKVNS